MEEQVGKVDLSWALRLGEDFLTGEEEKERAKRGFQAQGKMPSR